MRPTVTEPCAAWWRPYAGRSPAAGVEAVTVEAEGNGSHRAWLALAVVAEAGEDRLLRCASCGYAAIAEWAIVRKPPGPEGIPRPIEPMATPGQRTIEDLAGFLGVPPSATLKAVFYDVEGETVFVVIRGDLARSERKLARLLGARRLRLTPDAAVRGAGLVLGSTSPVGLRGIRVVGDDSIVGGVNFVAGANQPDIHLRKVNVPRDFAVVREGDIALARGEACIHCGGPLVADQAIVLGEVETVATSAAEARRARFLNREGSLQPLWLATYGLDVSRLLAAVLERHHDERGIVWSPEGALFAVYLVALGEDRPEVAAAAKAAYAALWNAGLETLYDEREETAGVKFMDADVLGLPLRLTVSRRSVASGGVELKERATGALRMRPLAEVVAGVQAALGTVARVR